jgi:integrase
VSIERVTRSRSRSGWKVRYRDHERRERAKTFDRKEDAEAFEAKVLLAKRRGDLEELDAGKETFANFTNEWWRLYGDPQLSPKTKLLYKSLLRRYLTPRLGRTQLRRIDARTVSSFQARMLADGVGKETTRKTLALLQGMLERAVEWGMLKTNPVKSVRKPSQRRQREVHLVVPATVETLRRHLLSIGRPRDATLVSVLAYAGLRPGEAIALTWGDIGEKTIRVTKSVSLGEVTGTKTGQARTVEILKPLATDLRSWRTQSKLDTSPDALVFPRRDGQVWKDADYRNWRKRVFVPAAKAANWGSKSPYDLRHSFASLMFVEGRNPIEIAQMLGHSPAVLFRTYAGVMAELVGSRRRNATTLIREARDRS